MLRVRPGSFTNVELSALGAMNDVYNVVRQAVELLRDVYLGLWPVTLVSVCANHVKRHVPHFAAAS